MYDLSTWPIFCFMHIWLWYPTLVVMGYLFLLYFYTQLKFYQEQTFWNVCIYVLAYCIHTEIYSKLNLPKEKKVFQ